MKNIAQNIVVTLIVIVSLSSCTSPRIVQVRSNNNPQPQHYMMSGQGDLQAPSPQGGFNPTLSTSPSMPSSQQTRVSYREVAGKSPTDPQLREISTYLDSNGKFHRNECGLLTENVIRGILGVRVAGRDKATIGFNRETQGYGIEQLSKEDVPISLVVNSCIYYNIWPSASRSPNLPDLQKLVREKWIKERGHDPMERSDRQPSRAPTSHQGSMGSPNGTPLPPPTPEAKVIESESGKLLQEA